MDIKIINDLWRLPEVIQQAHSKYGDSEKANLELEKMLNQIGLLLDGLVKSEESAIEIHRQLKDIYNKTIAREILDHTPQIVKEKLRQYGKEEIEKYFTQKDTEL